MEDVVESRELDKLFDCLLVGRHNLKDAVLKQ